MVNIQIVSDLHIDHHGKFEHPLKSIKPCAEYLLIVGDTCSLYNAEIFLNYMLTLSPLFKKIFIVPGNHEYYTVNGKEKHRISVLKKCLYFIAEKINNLVILDKSVTVIGDYILAGCTLWSNYDDQEELPRHFRIHKLTAEVYNKFHKRDVDFIKETMTRCKNNGKKLILATHYPPSKRFNDNPKYVPEYPSLYGSDLDNMIRDDNVHTWIFGHNHGLVERNVDVLINGTRVITNQKGRGANSTIDYCENKRLCF